MKNPHDIILRPVLTEKSYDGMADKRYVFEVAINANKIEIKQAVEAIFDVKVSSVNTINRKGKTHRTRTGIGKSKDTRRAIVTLREGTIDIFGDVA